MVTYDFDEFILTLGKVVKIICNTRIEIIRQFVLSALDWGSNVGSGIVSHRLPRSNFI